MRGADEGRAGKSKGTGVERALIPLILFKRFSLKSFRFFLLTACGLQLAACSIPAGVFEKDVTVPRQQWESNFKPRIDFIVKEEDTASLYNVYFVLRHTDAYNYNNIWIQGTVLQPGDTATKSERYNLVLATNEKGWTGDGMDDIYENRLQIQSQTKFKRPGTYTFMVEQIMREDPLKHILNVGIRVEKATVN
jgi:gliding motility-associated lipoprotein GldH